MKFQHYNLGHRKKGEVIQVNLSGNAANVQLMDSSNLQNYKSGRQYRYQGGYATKSPVNLQIPRSGQWHIALDLGGRGGTIRSSIKAVPAPYTLPEIKNAPLSTIPSLVQNDPIPSGMTDDELHREYDVFISHASEDKADVVRPLANALKAAGLKVWFDEFELKIGDSLRRKIDHGLSRSWFGVVVLSQSFLGKGWANASNQRRQINSNSALAPFVRPLHLNCVRPAWAGVQVPCRRIKSKCSKVIGAE